MSNPILNENFGTVSGVIEDGVMTINGTIQKTLLMLGITIIAAAYNWGLFLQGFTDKAQIFGIVGAIAAFIAVIIVNFVKKAAPLWAGIYSIGEGFFLGLISCFFERFYPGIVTQAVACTFAAMFSMLMLYRFNIIRCTEKFRSTIITATFSILIVYIIQFIASLFGRNIPEIFTASPIGIGFSVVVCIIAALNFILDFDFIEAGAQRLAPKYFEWMGAFGIMTSLVWLYVEVLRLLAKLNSRE